MGQLLTRRMPRSLLVGLLLAALACRALIPVGFMPAGDGSLAMMICPEGMAHHAGMVHHHAPGGTNHSEHCPFGATPGLGPASSLPGAAAPVPAIAAQVSLPASRIVPAPRQRAHAPRGPPGTIPFA